MFFFLSLLLQCEFANSTLLSLLSFSYFITPYDAQASSAFSALILFILLRLDFTNTLHRVAQAAKKAQAYHNKPRYTILQSVSNKS